MQVVKSKVESIEYKLLRNYPHLVGATFTRHGGVSEGRFGSLNLGSDSTADKPDAVKMNREQVRKVMGLSKIVYPHQNHGTDVAQVTSKNCDKIPQADALYTQDKDIGIAVTHADCQAAIFYDTVHEAIAVAHCGWKGSVQNIYARVIDTLKTKIGTQPHNLIVCISPSLGPDHSEFNNYRQELPKEFWEYDISNVKPHYFDFWAISRMQLTRCGVLDRNIEIAEICTCCNTQDYFSYRSEKETGRNATIVALKQ